MSKKNTAIFLAAIASATALATPIDALPKGQVEAADAANWKGTRAYTEDELKLMNSILSGVRNIVGSLKRNVDDQVMFRADKEARLQELLEAMAAFRAVENVLKFPTELNQQATKEARARINALIRASSSPRLTKATPISRKHATIFSAIRQIGPGSAHTGF